MHVLLDTDHYVTVTEATIQTRAVVWEQHVRGKQLTQAVCFSYLNHWSTAMKTPITLKVTFWENTYWYVAAQWSSEN